MMIIISPEFLPPAPEDYDLAARGGSVVIPLERSLQSLNYPSGFICFTSVNSESKLSSELR
jgi:hypothetical protein